MSDRNVSGRNVSDSHVNDSQDDADDGGVTVQGPSDDAPATQGFGGGDPTAGTGGPDEAGAGDTTAGDGDTLVDDDEARVPTGHQAADASDVDRGAQGRMRE